jgi:hypothetical protein
MRWYKICGNLYKQVNCLYGVVTGDVGKYTARMPLETTIICCEDELNCRKERRVLLRFDPVRTHNEILQTRSQAISTWMKVFFFGVYMINRNSLGRGSLDDVALTIAHHATISRQYTEECCDILPSIHLLINYVHSTLLHELPWAVLLYKHH